MPMGSAPMSRTLGRRTFTRDDAEKLFESDSDESNHSGNSSRPQSAGPHGITSGSRRSRPDDGFGKPQAGADQYGSDSSGGPAVRGDETHSASTSGRGSDVRRTTSRPKQPTKPSTPQLIKLAHTELNKAAQGPGVAPVDTHGSNDFLREDPARSSVAQHHMSATMKGMPRTTGKDLSSSSDEDDRPGPWTARAAAVKRERRILSRTCRPAMSPDKTSSQKPTTSETQGAPGQCNELTEATQSYGKHAHGTSCAAKDTTTSKPHPQGNGRSPSMPAASEGLPSSAPSQTLPVEDQQRVHNQALQATAAAAAAAGLAGCQSAESAELEGKGAPSAEAFSNTAGPARTAQRALRHPAGAQSLQQGPPASPQSPAHRIPRRVSGDTEVPCTDSPATPAAQRHLEAATPHGDAGLPCNSNRPTWGYLQHFGMGLSAALPAPPSNHPGGSPGNWQEQWRQAEGQAQCLEGDRHFFGHGCPCSWELAFRCYTKAAELGSAAGMCRLAACYQKGRGCLKDEAAAVHWYRRAAGHADLDALHALGELYESGELAAAGVAQDFKKAAKYYRRAAEAGHLGSQASLGFLYEQGLGLAQEPAAALKWYTAAAERGHAKAQNNLGALLSCGAPPNVEADPEAAVEWYRKSSQQGNAAAMNNLGIAAEEGAGMERDLEAAAALYRVAAEMGHGPAHANLAHLCVAQQDWVQAEEHFRRAADAGEGDAWLHLGTIYEHGLGHVRDLHAALRYYERAAAHGVLQADDCIGQALDKIDSQVGLDADPGELLERVHNSDACLASAKAELAVLRARLERSQAECETLHDELQLSGSGSHSFPAAAVTGRTLTAGGPTLTSSGSFLSAGREPSGGSMRRSSSMEQLGSSLSGGGRRTGSILNYRSPLLGRKNNSMPTDLLRSLVGRVYDDAAAADAGSQGQRQQFTTPATSTSPEFAGGPPATASVAAQPATAVARSGSLTPPGQAAEDQSLPVMRKAPAVDRSAILDSTGPLELRDQRSVTRAAAMPQPPAAAPVRPPGTALGSAPRQFSLKKSPSPLFSRQSSAARSVLEVSGPSYEAGPPSPTRRMNADATQRLQRKLAQRRERRKSSMGPIFSFTSRAASESRGHAAAEPLALPCGKSMAKAGGPGQARGTAASQRFVEKMTIMERVQQMSNRQLVKLKADNALLEDRAKDAEATATTLGQVMQKLYVRVMALEEQLRSAGLQPVQPAGTTIDTVAGIPVDDLGVAYSLPTAQLYNVFALRRPIDVPLDDEYGDVDDGFNAVPPEFFSTGSHHPPLGRRASVSAMHDAPPLPHATAPATMQGSEEASKQPSLLASSSSRRLSNPEVPPIRAAFDQSLRKQTLHNAMRLSTDVNQGPLGDEGLAGTPTAAPIGSEPTAGDPTNPTGQPTPAQPKKPRSILSQKSASDLSLKERRNSRLTIRIQGDAEPVLPAARSMVRASSTLT